MRAIKFRVWNYTTQTMEIVEELTYNHGVINQINTDRDRILFPDKECELMQFTGLTDKNGTPVYESDIVSLAGSMTGAEGFNPGFVFTEDDKAEIAWDSDIAAWSVAGQLDRTDRVEVTYRNHVIQLIQQGACEVIGNVHENPDLLT